MKRHVRVMTEEGEVVPEALQKWMVDCVMIARKMVVEPEYYVYELRSSGSWWSHWRRGMTPAQAVVVEFHGMPMPELVHRDLTEAMMHLEIITDSTYHICGEEADKRAWAAHQLIQAIVNRRKPDGYDETLSEVRALDALRNAMDRW